MRSAHRVSVLVALFLVVVPRLSAAQAVALTPEEMEHFLLSAPIVADKGLLKGVTKARRVTLSDGRTTHDAQVQQMLNIALPIFEVGPKHTEVNFKDTYRYNIAAYRLARLLGLDNVPMSVERVVDRKPSAVTWWIDNPVIEETARRKAKTESASPRRTDGYLHLMRWFDELIRNRDRNAGNILWESDGKDVAD